MKLFVEDPLRVHPAVLRRVVEGGRVPLSALTETLLGAAEGALLRGGHPPEERAILLESLRAFLRGHGAYRGLPDGRVLRAYLGDRPREECGSGGGGGRGGRPVDPRAEAVALLYRDVLGVEPPPVPGSGASRA